MRKISFQMAALSVLISISSTAFAAVEQRTATMYKPMQCGCCDVYARYLEDNGFEVVVKSLRYSQLKSIKKMAGVSEQLEGCHTLVVDGYTVDGLVPMKTLDKLLTEKPKIRGISLPGMPVGAPGMPGIKRAPLVIYELSQGNPNIYAVE